MADFSGVRYLVWWIDADSFRKRLEHRCSADKTLWMGGTGSLQSALSMCGHGFDSAVVNIVGPQQSDAAVAVLGVVPGEEVRQKPPVS